MRHVYFNIVLRIHFTKDPPLKLFNAVYCCHQLVYIHISSQIFFAKVNYIMYAWLCSCHPETFMYAFSKKPALSYYIIIGPNHYIWQSI